MVYGLIWLYLGSESVLMGIRVKIDSVYRIMMDRDHIPYYYCIIKCGPESYISTINYDDLVKFIGKWVICQINSHTNVVKYHHKGLLVLQSIAFGNALDHFILRRDDAFVG